ncbi:hypothetical protein YC2023_112795 [Brassica napus]
MGAHITSPRPRDKQQPICGVGDVNPPQVKRAKAISSSSPSCSLKSELSNRGLMKQINLLLRVAFAYVLAAAPWVYFTRRMKPIRAELS